MTVSWGDGRFPNLNQHRTIPPGSSRPVGRPLARLRKSLVLVAKIERIDLPTALLAGATKAEAAARRRAKRKKERILSVTGVVRSFVVVLPD